VRIAVTGTRGQVARALAERGAARGHEIVLVGRPALDLAGSAEAIAEALEAVRPDAIVSAAAYTAVDNAESEPEAAAMINAEGGGAVAQVAARLGVPLCHLSTDYVFDGAAHRPYRENDPTGPVGVYGRTKLDGEAHVLASGARAAILRTAWVYSPFGANFVKTMLRLAADRDEVSVVADQTGCPTSALDIADGVLDVLANLTRSDDPALTGVFHMCGTGTATWADFADAIFTVSHRQGGPVASVRRITTVEFPTPARRPANSRLDCARLEQVHAVRLPDWQTSLETVVTRLVHELQETA
jgi:dTDP-4-dehydrorhamnose reductase